MRGDKSMSNKRKGKMFGGKFLTSLLALFLAVGFLSLDVRAEEVQTGTVDGIVSGSVTWTYDPETKTTTVTGTGERSVGSTTTSPFPTGTESIRFESCKISGDCRYLFGGLSNLNTIDFSGFDTGGVTDMTGMFADCSGLTSLDLSGFDTSSVTDMRSMFSGCRGLTSLDLSGFDTGSVMNMERMFYYCSGLTNLDLSGFDTSSVTSMERMFYYCSGLTSVDVSGLDTSSVTYMGEMFEYCSSLTSVDVSGFDTSSVTNMGFMFTGCKSLTSVDVSGFATGSVTNMGSMFTGCSGLTSVDVSGFDTGSVTNMGSMFSGCSGLTSVDVSGFATGSVTGMMGMFADCSGLTSVDVSGFDTGSVTNMGSMFSGCSGLTSVDVSGFATGSVTNMGWMFADCSGLTSLDVSSFDTSGVKDMRMMFSGCSSLTSLDLSGFDTSSVTDMSWLFFVCSGLTNVDMSGFDTSSVTDMTGMFLGCGDLTSLDLGSFDTSSVTDMTGMFMDCSDLTSLNLSSFDTSSVTSMGKMFGYCSGLTSLDLSSFDTSSVMTSIEDMFEGCWNLTDLSAPKQMGSVSADLPGTFADPDGNETSELTSVYAGKKLTKVETETPEVPETPADLPQAIRYVPYETQLVSEGYDNFILAEGALPQGLTLAENGRLSGVPTEAGDFSFQVKASGNDTAEKTFAYRLTVEQNTEANMEISTDKGYELVETVPDLKGEELPAQKEQTMRSVGAYEEFVALYLDGGKLIRGEGDELTGDAEYLANPGSTRITILNQTLAKNGPGTHTLAMEFRKSDTGELRRAMQNYTIEGEKPAPGDDTDKEEPKEPDDVKEPEEEDDDGDTEAHSEVTLKTIAMNTIYTVLPGDTLWKIAQKVYGDGKLWERIYRNNAGQIRNPGVIYAGMRLQIEQAGESAVQSGSGSTDHTDSGNTAPAQSGLKKKGYRVTSGDTLWQIARKVYGNGVLWREIYQQNQDKIADPGQIRPGQELVVPER